jgi:hypothetical protein
MIRVAFMGCPGCANLSDPFNGAVSCRDRYLSSKMAIDCGRRGKRLGSMSIAFKEWAIVCEALKSGRQTLILRKGGIAEGRAGFSFKHDRFLLFPTRFHEQIARTILPADTPLPDLPEAEHRIDLAAQVVWAGMATDVELVERLAPFHILRPEVIKERIAYDEPAGINIAVVRTFILRQPHVFPDLPKYGGCRSWVEVPDAEEAGATPVLDEAAFAKRLEELRECGLPISEAQAAQASTSA